MFRKTIRIPFKLIDENILRGNYNLHKCFSHTENEKTAPVKVKGRVKKGCSLSTTFYNIYLDNMIIK